MIMDYNDDLLNVYGLLRKKSSINNMELLDIATSQLKNEQLIDNISARTNDMEIRIQALSEKCGLEFEPLNNIAEEETEYDSVSRIIISSNYDFKGAFKELVREANNAGFTNIQPEELLSESEMMRAVEREKHINEKFAYETRLRNKDVGILLIASAIKIVAQYYDIFVLNKKEDDRQIPKNKIKVDKNQTSVDAFQGVDLSQLADENLPNLIKSGKENVLKFLGDNSKISRVLDKDTILSEPVPFDIEDNSLFKHQDIIGYDPILGWLFGVINFMTNTVTTKKLNSFTIHNSNNGKVFVGEKISTPIHVLYPIVRNINENKYSIVAAVIREADVLNITHSPYSTVSKLFGIIQNEIDKKEKLISNAQSFSPLKKIDLSKILKESTLLSFIDILVAAVCSVFYEPDLDGNENYYAIRMHKIILISNAFTAIANNIPVIMTKKVSDIDFSSILNTLLSLFHSSKFWIDIKTQYLVSEHKKIIDTQLDQVNKYFSIID